MHLHVILPLTHLMTGHENYTDFKKDRCPRGGPERASSSVDVGGPMKLLRIRGRTGWLAILVPVLVLTVSSAAWAQRTDGEIQGSVRDSTMGSIPGAAVVATNVNTGYTRAITSDTRGDFFLPQLQPGEYRLEVTADGFKVHVQTVKVSALMTASDSALDIAATADPVPRVGM